MSTTTGAAHSNHACDTLADVDCASSSERVLQANVEVHTRLAKQYDETEPHFRPENIARVGARLHDIVQRTRAESLLDLGCGTGFMIRVAAPLVKRIHGVDATQAMLDRVDRSGPARITLQRADSGDCESEPGAFDVVTAYSFLHHLYDIGPTLRTAWRALRPDGVFFAGLDPNYYFWNAVGRLAPYDHYDAVVMREIAAVRQKDREIEERFGINGETFNDAEYGKNRRGGFREFALRDDLRDAGFRQVEVFYEWFVGQGQLINDPELGRAEGLHRAETVEAALHRMLPLSRHLFKYVGFVAIK